MFLPSFYAKEINMSKHGWDADIIDSWLNFSSWATTTDSNKAVVNFLIKKFFAQLAYFKFFCNYELGAIHKQCRRIFQILCSASLSLLFFIIFGLITPLLKTRYLFSSPFISFEEGPPPSPFEETLFMDSPLWVQTVIFKIWLIFII